MSGAAEVSGGDGSDLVGDIGDSGAIGGGDGNTAQGGLDAVNSGIAEANSNKDALEQQKETERKLIKQYWTEYEAARDFDKAARRSAFSRSSLMTDAWSTGKICRGTSSVTPADLVSVTVRPFIDSARAEGRQGESTLETSKGSAV